MHHVRGLKKRNKLPSKFVLRLESPSPTLRSGSVFFFDAAFHQLSQVWILHGGRYPFLIVDLLVNCNIKPIVISPSPTDFAKMIA